MNTPFFSVIITTYNRCNILPQALNSLINQSETSWEAVIIDDGSTDQTHSNIKNVLSRHPHLIYHWQNNQGEVGAKNAGIILARGRYVTFLDSDDRYKYNHLEIRRSVLEKNPQVDLLHGGVEVMGSEYVPDRFDPEKKIHLSKCVIGGTFFIKRKLLISIGGFRKINLGADADLFERLSNQKVDIMKVNFPTYIYNRLGEDSITHNIANNEY